MCEQFGFWWGVAAGAGGWLLLAVCAAAVFSAIKVPLLADDPDESALPRRYW